MGTSAAPSNFNGRGFADGQRPFKCRSPMPWYKFIRLSYFLAPSFPFIYSFPIFTDCFLFRHCLDFCPRNWPTRKKMLFAKCYIFNRPFRLAITCCHSQESFSRFFSLLTYVITQLKRKEERRTSCLDLGGHNVWESQSRCSGTRCSVPSTITSSCLFRLTLSFLHKVCACIWFVLAWVFSWSSNFIRVWSIPPATEFPDTAKPEYAN